MIAVRFLPRKEWETKLRSYGCKPLDGKEPWGGYPFTVPVEEDGMCLEEAIRRLILQIVAAAPKGWRFPE